MVFIVCSAGSYVTKISSRLGSDWAYAHDDKTLLSLNWEFGFAMVAVIFVQKKCVCRGQVVYARGGGGG